MVTLPLQVLHRPRCPFCRRLRAYLVERDIEVELVDYDPAVHHDRLLRLNPKAQVPVLELPSGLALYESSIIMEYLEDERPGSGLTPTAPEARARMRLLYDLADVGIAKHLPHFVRAPADAPEKVSHHRALIDQVAVAERWLSRVGPYVEGAAFSMADLSLPPLIFRALEAGLVWEELSERTRAWCAATLERPSVRGLFPEVKVG